MLKAKRAVEMALALGSAVIDLPMVEDKNILSDELGAAGIADGYEALTFEAAHPGLATRRCRALLGPARPLC
ncbi:hypothetical protein [Paracoccus sulfuroxidans]|uniref:hypothetical protein n=1 Tax=Paracoccus sulfuroxidans TaxID=384678 RepID=UPI0011AA2138|nr:hypothetical protein [Paracoccus sulfuroxidans]